LSKNTRGNKEFTRLQESLYENKRLKREISSLRKQLARLDLDRHGYVKDIIEEHCAQEESAEMMKRLKNEWKCHVCGIGYLEIFTYNRINDTYYYRKCSNCIHRTKSQKYDPEEVKGIVKIKI
jgi:regulator of replication initiation timing